MIEILGISVTHHRKKVYFLISLLVRRSSLQGYHSTHFMQTIPALEMPRKGKKRENSEDLTQPDTWSIYALTI